MARNRIKNADFSKGLWLSSSKDQMPPGTLRRARGINHVPTTQLRSRWGDVVVYSTPNGDAHTLFRYNDHLYFVIGAKIYKDNVLIYTGSIAQRASFLSVPPTTGTTDYLYVTGLGANIKISPGGTVSSVGIVAPPDGFAVAAGGAGPLTGTYQYLVTYRDTVTGVRSNPNPTAVSVVLAGQDGSLTGLPVSADAQVNQREIWRTVGNGGTFFRAFTVNDNTTTAATDSVADSALQATVIDFDNNVPDANFLYSWGKWFGRVWWARQDQGIVYYSGIDRVEAETGFVRLENNDHPMRGGIIWNGANYGFTTQKCFRIDGTTEPFVVREVYGVPGLHPNASATLIGTPFGICYQAAEQIYIFTGTTARPLYAEGLTTILRGENVENLTGFLGITACYSNEEYVISDGQQTLACNLRTGAWRDIGAGYNGLYGEPVTAGNMSIEQHKLASPVGLNEIIELELAGTTSASTPFDVKMPALTFGAEPVMIERIYVDSTTASQDVILSVDFDNTNVLQGTINHAARTQDQFLLNKHARIVDVQLTGTLSGIVELFAIEYEFRTIPLYLLENGHFVVTNQGVLELPGTVMDLSTGIAYYGIEDKISQMNIVYRPEIRRLYVDAHTHDLTITPTLEFYGSTVVLPAYTSSERTIIEWDINVSDRLVSITLAGDFRTIQLWQLAIDTQVGVIP